MTFTAFGYRCLDTPLLSLAPKLSANVGRIKTMTSSLSRAASVLSSRVALFKARRADAMPTFPPLLHTCSQIRVQAGTIYCAKVKLVYYQVTDLVRFLAALPTPFRRSIRTIIWDNNEPLPHMQHQLLKEHYEILSSRPFAHDLRRAILQTRVFPPEGGVKSYRFDEEI